MPVCYSNFRVCDVFWLTLFFPSHSLFKLHRNLRGYCGHSPFEMRELGLREAKTLAQGKDRDHHKVCLLPLTATEREVAGFLERRGWVGERDKQRFAS